MPNGWNWANSSNLFLLAGGAILSLATLGWLWTYDSGANVNLTRTNTVHDFRSASRQSQSRWLDAMCNNGACLGPIDWKCGFTFTRARPDKFADSQVRDQMYRDQKRVRECVGSLTTKAPATDDLGKLALICGRRHMFFIGDSAYTPEDCKAAGGEWGIRAQLFRDEDQYISKQEH